MNIARRFRKKPVVIEAIQFDGENFDSCKLFAAETSHVIQIKDSDLVLHTPEGPMLASPGDWIIRQGLVGEIYPCKPLIFNATYKEVLDAQNI